MQQDHRVGHERLEVIAGRAVVRVAPCLNESGLAPNALSTSLFSLIRSCELRLEALRVDQVDHAQADARGLVAVGRADAALGGADLVLALEHLALRVQFAVIREHHVRGFADEQVAVSLHAQLAQALDLLDQADGIDHHAVADDAELFLRRMPDGIRCRTYFCPLMKTVCPALLPPCVRTTTSACSVSTSMILPLPSSPHWAPTRIVFAINQIKIPEREFGAKLVKSLRAEAKNRP